MQVIKEYSGIKVTVNEEDLNKKGVIYLLEFPNGKVYIGQTTKKVRERIYEHCGISNHCRKLKRAINKYKEFKVSVLEENLTLEQLNSFEEYYIKLFNSNGIDGYNLDSGGRNKKMSEETKKKISEGRKGVNMSEETKKKISEGNKGKHYGERSDSFKKQMLSIFGKNIKSIPDNIIFSSVKEATEYYKIGRISDYYNGKVHKKSGQSFILIDTKIVGSASLPIKEV